MASGMIEMFSQAEMTDHAAPFFGQNAGMIDDIKLVAKVLKDMVEETVDILTRRLPANVSAKA